MRDRFVLTGLRELGLRTTEFIKATMGAFQPLSDPKAGHTYWIMHVIQESAKGRVERKIPVTKQALAALTAYRKAFGLSSLPLPGENTPLLLSPRTRKSATTARGIPLSSLTARRDFGAWRSLTSRHSLYAIVKDRLAQAAALLESIGVERTDSHSAFGERILISMDAAASTHVQEFLMDGAHSLADLTFALDRLVALDECPPQVSRYVGIAP